MAATTVIMYYAMTNYYKNNELNSVWGVLIVMIFIEVFLFLQVIALISYATGSMFMSVWGMAADAIL